MVFRFRFSEGSDFPWRDDDGDWVEYTDYQRLEAQLAAERKSVDELARHAQDLAQELRALKNKISVPNTDKWGEEDGFINESI